MSGGKGNYCLKRKDLLYPELSFKINAVLFEVFKQIGGGHLERYYQRAVKCGLEAAGIQFKEQYYVLLKFDKTIVGKYYLDFLVEGAVVLELKRRRFVSTHVINQTKRYLSALDLEFGLIACFTQHGVFSKRIINQY